MTENGVPGGGKNTRLNGQISLPEKPLPEAVAVTEKWSRHKKGTVKSIHKHLPVLPLSKGTPEVESASEAAPQAPPPVLRRFEVFPTPAWVTVAAILPSAIQPAVALVGAVSLSPVTLLPVPATGDAGVTASPLTRGIGPRALMAGDERELLALRVEVRQLRHRVVELEGRGGSDVHNTTGAGDDVRRGDAVAARGGSGPSAGAHQGGATSTSSGLVRRRLRRR